MANANMKMSLLLLIGILLSSYTVTADTHLVLRYEVDSVTNTFRATPTTGTAWNAVLYGSAFITTMGEHAVIDMGNNNGYVDLGRQAGKTLQTLPEFTTETYVYIPFQNILKNNGVEGHYLWSFANTPDITPTRGGYLSMKAAERTFALSADGTNGQVPAYARFGNSHNPFRRGIWEHVVLTRSGNTYRLYVNGKLEGTHDTTIALSNLEFNYLARPLIGTAHLDGAKFYRFSIYSKAFSQPEVANELGANEIMKGFPRERILSKDSSVPMKHVGGIHTPDDFVRIREKIQAGEEPWATGYQQLLKNSHTQKNWNGPHPTEYIIRGGVTPNGNENYMNAARSAAAAYQLALIYHIGLVENPREYADRAVNILNRWADVNKHLDGNSNVSLASGLYGYMFALAGELMRNDDGWTPADFAKYQQWLLDVFYDSAMDFLIRHHNCWDDHYWTNWDMCNLAALMAIGIVCDRRDIYNWALEALQGNYGEPHKPYPAAQRRVLGNGYWFKAINFIHTTEDGEELAQQQESGRDQGHTVMNIGMMAVIAEMAWHQGDDLYGLGDNLLLKMCEYVSKYNIARLDVPFNTYIRLWQSNPTPSRNTMTEVATSIRGHNRPVWGMPYYHYTVVKGVDLVKTPWTKLATEAEFSLQHWGPQMGNNSGAYDSPGFSLLMFAR